MGSTLVTLIVSIYSYSTGIESTRTERMPLKQCEAQVAQAVKASGPGDVTIAQCVADSKFFK